MTRWNYIAQIHKGQRHTVFGVDDSYAIRSDETNTPFPGCSNKLSLQGLPVFGKLGKAAAFDDHAANPLTPALFHNFRNSFGGSQDDRQIDVMIDFIERFIN